MDINTAKEALLKRSNAFRERYFTAYGQLVLRVNEETYISSRENLRLSKLTGKDFDLFDINTGDIGRIFFISGRYQRHRVHMHGSRRAFF